MFYEKNQTNLNENEVIINKIKIKYHKLTKIKYNGKIFLCDEIFIIDLVTCLGV